MIFIRYINEGIEAASPISMVTEFTVEDEYKTNVWFGTDGVEVPWSLDFILSQMMCFSPNLYGVIDLRPTDK